MTRGGGQIYDGASTAMNATCTKREGRHRKRAKPIVLLFILLLSLPLAGAFDPQKTDGGDSKSCDEPAANMPTNKEEWPELAGKTGEEAKAAILTERGTGLLPACANDVIRAHQPPSTNRMAAMNVVRA